MQTNVNKPAAATTATDKAADKAAKLAASKAKRDAAKAAKAAKPAAAPKADAAQARAAIAAQIATERKTASDVFAKLSSAVSVPVKPLAAFKRTYKRDVSAHAIGRKPSARQAAALYVALTASKAKLADGVKFPRQFTIRGATYAIENGALSDAIASGLCTYNAATETITLRSAAELQSQIKTTGFNI